jgi:mannuronan 5-epimerase
VNFYFLTVIILLVATTIFIFNKFNIAFSEIIQKPLPIEKCISYTDSERTIRVSCKVTFLSDIYNHLKNKNILKEQKNRIWLLNASIIIEKGSTLNITSKDTKWLKIISNDKNANSIQVIGNLNIDSVKITSWDPSTNNYKKFAIDKFLNNMSINDISIKYDKYPRPYIVVDKDSNGTTNIINSEISYLGYSCGSGKCHGLSYWGSNNSIIKDNNIHHNHFGLYSSELSNIIFENNNVHNNFAYGIDPHTGTHNMTIRNNTVHNNGHIGIICSLDCYNITIADNKVYDNVKTGIMFSKNMQDSIAKNNIIYNERTGISISESCNNEVYDNTISNITIGINLKNESCNNSILDNVIRDPITGIKIHKSTFKNIVNSNTIINAKENPIIVNKKGIDSNTIKNNNIINQ